MNQTITALSQAIEDLKSGKGIIVVDNENRENEGDLIFPAETLTNEQMAVLIRDCSGIVCLCITDERRKQLGLEMMVKQNNSQYGTAFTVTIEAAEGVTTGVSAADRVTTVKAAIKDGASSSDIASPGHLFPLVARAGGVIEREGHTEATIDLMKLAGYKPYGVLCELTNPDGTMMKMPDIEKYADEHGYTILTIDELKAHLS